MRRFHCGGFGLFLWFGVRDRLSVGRHQQESRPSLSTGGATERISSNHRKYARELHVSPVRYRRRSQTAHSPQPHPALKKENLMRNFGRALSNKGVGRRAARTQSLRRESNESCPNAVDRFGGRASAC